MLYLIQYIIAIVIVMLFLVGFTLLSVRLHTREEICQQLEEKVQLQATDDPPKAEKPPKRHLFEIFRGERTLF